MARANLSAGKAAVVEGIPELVKSIEALQERVTGEDILHVLMAAAQTMKDKAREIAPADTGKLRDHIIATYGAQRGRRTDDLNVVVMVKWREQDGPRYPFMVEYGTSERPANPYMRTALKVAKPQMVAIIGDGFRKIVEDATK